MDPLTSTVMIVLAKYALDEGGKLVKEVGPKAVEAAKDMFTLVMDRLRRKPTGAVVCDGFKADPETYAKPVQKELESALREDSALRTQLDELRKRYEAAARAAGARVTIVGDGAAAVGPGARAASTGGVIVDGDVHGGVSTGGAVRGRKPGAETDDEA